VAPFLHRSFLIRFAPALCGSLGAGYLAFRGQIFEPSGLPFQAVTIGALSAAVLSLLRVSRGGIAVMLVLLFGVGQLGMARAAGWMPALGGLLFGVGILLIALIFDLLGRGGLIFGKFLILGPLLAGLYVGLMPMMTFHTLAADDTLREVMLRVLLGLVVGDGVGLGVEIGELFGDTPAAREAA